MKKLNFRPSFLQVLYLIVYVILFFLIVYIPTLITGPLFVAKRIIIEEETIEGILLGIAFILSILIFNLYRNDVKSHKEQVEKIKTEKKKVDERLILSDRYIGAVNVQIQEFTAIFNNTEHYPESPADLKKTFHYLGRRVLTIINTNWVLIRIINTSNQKTICEHFGKKEGFECDYPHVSNRMIMEKNAFPPYTTVVNHAKNLNVTVFSVLPVMKISPDQQVFMQAIVNEITKLFIIVNSTFRPDCK